MLCTTSANVIIIYTAVRETCTSLLPRLAELNQVHMLE